MGNRQEMYGYCSQRIHSSRKQLYICIDCVVWGSDTMSHCHGNNTITVTIEGHDMPHAASLGSI